ncbi:hypothetical protein ACCUM_3559 [Candidatus Accumulibacter phosphatis]|uniref:Uncharacterized protein n=1 Tax=Candidatus Accumulibacter phosphatis TaxID=327160 RepID=A0A5S4EHF0_9PROT|nr:hypothetical protein ACCUM_3559 [Candidatus Accumulibacter phosphatis]
MLKRSMDLIKENNADIVALVAAKEAPFRASHWLIHFADHHPLEEVAFSPAFIDAEVLGSSPVR